MSSWLGKSLLKLFADPHERIRALSIDLFRSSIAKGQDAVLELLPYVMPVLEERLLRQQHSKGPAEASEELRRDLLLVRFSSASLATQLDIFALLQGQVCPKTQLWHDLPAIGPIGSPSTVC